MSTRSARRRQAMNNGTTKQLWPHRRPTGETQSNSLCYCLGKAAVITQCCERSHILGPTASVNRWASMEHYVELNQATIEVS
jgi:hypothetical protein